MASRSRNPFAYDGETTRLRSSIAGMEEVTALLEDTDTVHMTESLAVWDLYMKATGHETETMPGSTAADRIEQYPDDYTVMDTEILFESENDDPRVAYTIKISGKREVMGQSAVVPPTKIRGDLEIYDDVQDELEERYSIMTAEDTQQRGPHGPGIATK